MDLIFILPKGSFLSRGCHVVANDFIVLRFCILVDKMMLMSESFLRIGAIWRRKQKHMFYLKVVP